MTCYECGSEVHFANKCPNTQSAVALFVNASGGCGPLDGLVEQPTLHATQVLMMTNEVQLTTQNWGEHIGAAWQFPFSFSSTERQQWQCYGDLEADAFATADSGRT